MMKTVTLAVIVIMFCTGLCSAAELEKRVVRSIAEADDIQPLQTAVWDELYGAPEYDKKFCQTLYMWAFFDALSLYALECPSIQKLLLHYEGMTFEEVVDTINTFYREHPSQRDFAPALVTSIIIPELRERLPLLLEEYEE